MSAMTVAGTAVAACAGTPAPTTLPEEEPAAAPQLTARVAAIRGNDLDTMTREALEAVGGIQKIVNEGETVFIKPNMVTLPWAHLGRDPFVLGECANTVTTYGFDPVTGMQETKCTLCQIRAT